MRETGGRLRPVIALLTPFGGGTYFGGVVTGVATACAAGQADLVVVQTYDAGLIDSDIVMEPDFQLPVGHDIVDGWIVVNNGVGKAYVHALRSAGKPVVLVSMELAGEDCPAVLPDNRSGVLEAVRHLLDHGHERIAFVGNLDQHDVRQRHRAYQEALATAGHPADPALLFDIHDNLLGGGLAAGTRLLAAGLPSTAVMAATDLNALGLMEALRVAGQVLPRDQAVIGFDDIELAAQGTPPLTTVAHQVTEIGATATRLVLAGVRGDHVAPGPRYLDGGLVLRNSCGCTEPPDTTADALALAATEREVSEVRLGAIVKTQYEVSMELLTSRAGEAASLTWLSWTAAVAGCLALSAGPREETAERTGQSLRYAGTYHEHGLLDGVRVGGTVTVRRFPPDAMLAAAEGRPAHALFVVPIKSGSTDRGLLAVIAPVERVVMTARDLVNQWAALLSVALDHEAALASLEQQRARLHGSHLREQQLAEKVRLSEHRYALAAQASNDGLWDWDITHGTMYWSDRWRSIAGVGPDDGRGPEDWFARVHPDDLPSLRAAIAAHLAGTTPTVEHEHRMCVAEFHDRWVHCRAICLRDAGGAATRLVGSTADITNRKLLEQTLRHNALHDDLTGLPNRVLFMERLERVVELDRRRPEGDYAVLFIDLDNFKTVNDTLGHAAGDLVLTAVGNRLTTTLRGEDSAARFGGDEFAALITHLGDRADVGAAADRLRRHIEEPIEVAGRTVTMSASVGIACSDGPHRSAAQLLRAADQAMYRAKSAGGGRYSVYDADLDPPSVP